MGKRTTEDEVFWRKWVAIDVLDKITSSGVLIDAKSGLMLVPKITRTLSHRT